MRRPTSILGLMMEVIRRRAGAKGLFAVALGGAVAALSLRARTPEPPRAQRSAEPAWWSRPNGEAAADDFDYDVNAIATSEGWLVAWTRWTRDDGHRLLALSLSREGVPRGAPVALSPEGSNARDVQLARGRARCGVTWAGSMPGERWPPRAWFAALGPRGEVEVAARPLGREGDDSYDPSIAWEGEGWGVGWAALRGGYVIARLDADGGARGPRIELPGRAEERPEAAMAWTGDAWLVAQNLHDRDLDRSAIGLRWVDRAGVVTAAHRTTWAPGDLGRIAVSARGAEAWVTWGDDAGFSIRHDPRLARTSGRAISLPPRAIGPRRSGDAPTVSCDAAGCVAAWAGIVGERPAALQVVALTHDGAPRSAQRALGPRAALAWRGRVALARSLDERELLAVWPVWDGDRVRLLRVRLDADGAPLGPPQRLQGGAQSIRPPR